MNQNTQLEKKSKLWPKLTICLFRPALEQFTWLKKSPKQAGDAVACIHDYRSHLDPEVSLTGPTYFSDWFTLLLSSRVILLHNICHIDTHGEGGDRMREAWGCFLLLMIDLSRIWEHSPRPPSSCLSNRFLRASSVSCAPCWMPSCLPGTSLRCLPGSSHMTGPNRTLGSVCFFTISLQRTKFISLLVFFHW